MRKGGCCASVNSEVLLEYRKSSHVEEQVGVIRVAGVGGKDKRCTLAFCQEELSVN